MRSAKGFSGYRPDWDAMRFFEVLTQLSWLAELLRPGFSCFHRLVTGWQTFLSGGAIRWGLCLGLILAPSALPAATWYVSATVASSGNGQSWATAWQNSSNIPWGTISAGDTIYFDGGTVGRSYGAFTTITASGTSANYITIARSLEPGRAGIVTIATPCVISGNYIKFDGGGYLLVGGNTYRCGIVFTCSTRAATGSIQTGASVAVTGQRPWFRYCYFNGTYEAPTGHSFGARNSTGFVLERCWFYQSNWEDQWIYEASSGGGSVALTNTVFQDNNKPDRTDNEHRDVANPFTGTGGWNLYVVGCMFFNTPGHASDQPQGDALLLQVGYNSSTTPMNEVIAINNVCDNTLRFIAFGSLNSGVNRFVAYHNTVRNVGGGDGIGISVVPPALAPTSANNIQKNTSNPGFVNATSPLGADGIPFTIDDGFNITASSSALNAGSSVGVPTDIRGNARTGNPDWGAYEFGIGRPALHLRLTTTNTIALFWPTLAAGYTLQQNTNVAGPNWSAVGTPPTDDGTTKTVILNPSGGQRFYRLVHP
jgi:hypothetical protein